MSRFLTSMTLRDMRRAEENARKEAEERAAAEAKRLRDENLLPILDSVEEAVGNIWKEFTRAREIDSLSGNGARVERRDSIYGFLLHDHDPADERYLSKAHLRLTLSSADTFDLGITLSWQDHPHYESNVELRELAFYLAKEIGIKVRGLKHTDTISGTERGAKKVFEIKPSQSLKDIFSADNLVTVEGQVYFRP